MITSEEITRQRLDNQLITNQTPISPAEVVSRLGIVQAQDYLGALWALGLRTPGSTEASIDKALADQTIVRTWLSRGTLHFVTPKDVRWILALLAPRVIASAKGRYRQLGLDEETFAKSRIVFSEVLRGGNQLTRGEIFQALKAAGVSTEGQRGAHILGWNSAQGEICFGPRHGKQHTFVLLDEWVPQAKTFDRDQALAELSRRYFTSHGPATLRDYVWWSGLTTAEASQGIEMAGDSLVKDERDGEIYWMPASQNRNKAVNEEVYLLPPFDEFLVGYTDRSAALDPMFASRVNNGGGILKQVIVRNGGVLGIWKRTLAKSSVTVSPAWFSAPSQNQIQAFESAARRYGAFLGLTATVA